MKKCIILANGKPPKKSVIIKNTSVYYEQIGSGIPILNIHGFGVDRELLKNSIEY